MAGGDMKLWPKLNYEASDSLYEYIMKVARKWVSPPYNVDGWRLDVAADLGHSNEYNHKFWRDFRKNVKEAIQMRLFWRNIMEMPRAG